MLPGEKKWSSLVNSKATVASGIGTEREGEMLMGYPTSASATSRARSVTGLSNVATTSASMGQAIVDAIGSMTMPELPANWNIPGGPTPMEPPPSANDPFPSGVGPSKPTPVGSPPPVGAPKPVGSPVPTGVKMPSPMAGPPLELAYPKTPAVGSLAARAAWGALGALDAAMWPLAALWAAQELYRWNEARKLGNHQKGGFTYPNPADYGAGSYVDPCDAYAGPLGGPFPGASLCGSVSNTPFDTPEEVSYVYGQYPEYPDQPPEEWPVYLDRVRYNTKNWFSLPSHNASPNTRVSLNVAPPLWQYPAGTEPAPDDQTAPWWPKQSPDIHNNPDAPPAPDAPPMLDPLSQPLTSPYPAPTPSRIPYKLIPELVPNPWRSPTEQPTRGYELPAEPVPEPLAPPSPAPPGRPPKKGKWKKWPRRPGKNEKERKINRAGAVAVGFAMQVTEANDVADALWDALPDWARTPNASINDKYKDLYKHWPSMDLETGLENVVINAIEDAVIGLVEGKIDAASPRPGMPRWLNNPTRPEFEQELAQAVNDYAENWVRDVIEIE